MFIKVKVSVNSKKEEVIKKSEDAYEIKVKEKPVRGEANKALFRIIALYFKIPEKNIRLVKGFKQRNKVFEIK